MTITLLQQDISWANPAENQRRSEAAILAAPLSDLYVLPEMWSTGFNAIDEDTTSLRWMKDMAVRMNAAIAGSLSVKAEDGTKRNRFYFVMPPTEENPEGRVEHYDKRHLFSYGNEQLHYSAGEDQKIVKWRGVKFLLQVCYDLRFPVFSRNRIVRSKTPSDEGSSECLYDCILYIASWPASRIKPWHILTQARAVENQCYVAAVNRVGEDPKCKYCGGTEMIDAYGRVVASCTDDEIASITCELQMDALDSFRKKFPVLDDADSFQLYCK
jgi:predicted amidohydrolase